MARYIVTSGSHFEPFTYDELAKPLQQMAEAHNATQDAYDTLNLETNALKNYITDNPEDKKAKAMYDSYVEKLSTLQNNLWNNGYTTQTRRDLAAARQGYASDITRLAKAIQSRQERSKAYWDTKANNPDMIMGDDPSLAGLDAYLDDENYGQNYYTYSGKSFMNEVGTDAKARATELLRSPEYAKNPQLAGYITKIVQEGFTSDEVNQAFNAVKQSLAGDDSARKALSPEATILADVLQSHLNSTGARGKVSDAEFDRLLEYGRDGLSQAIGRTSTHEINDKVWDYNMAARANARKSPTGGNGYQGGSGYTLNDISAYLEGRSAKNNNKAIKKNLEDPFSNPIIYNKPDGTTGVITGPTDAQTILDSFGKKKLKDDYNLPAKILDMRNFSNTKEPLMMFAGGANHIPTTWELPDGRKARLYDGKEGLAVQIKVGNKWETDNVMTDSFMQDWDAYKNNVQAWRQLNKDLSGSSNLEKLAITDRQRKKMALENNIPADIPFEYYPAIMNTLSKEGRVTPATIAGSTADMASTRNNYAANIMTSFGRARGDKAKVSKTSEAAFYPVDGYDISEEGEGKIENVFKKNSVVNEITVLPEDVLKNKVRIMVDSKEWAINPAMLGNDVDFAMQLLKMPATSQDGRLLDRDGIVDYMMTPVLNPVAALRMSNEEAADWIAKTTATLGNYLQLAGYDASGNFVAITPEDIVLDEGLQGQLRTAVTMFMNNIFANPRDNMMLNNMQVRGNTSANAEGYNDYIFAQ